MTPQTDTVPSTSIADPKRSIRRTLRTLTPNALALDSPAVMMFISLVLTKMSDPPIMRQTSITRSSFHPQPSKLPSIQNTIDVTVSASEKNSIIEVRPENMALTAIPARSSRVVCTPPFLRYASIYANRSVAMAITNADSIVPKPLTTMVEPMAI